MSEPKRYYKVGYSQVYEDNFEEIFRQIKKEESELDKQIESLLEEATNGTARGENGALYQHCNCCLGPDCNMGNSQLEYSDENRNNAIPKNVWSDSRRS